MFFQANNIISEKRKYVPPVLGNGDLSCFIDYTGGMLQKEYSGGIVPGIWRAGVRYDNYAHELVPFGWFLEADAVVEGEWTQSLHLDIPHSDSCCHFPDGTILEAKVFCHSCLPILAVHWKKNEGHGLSFVYRLNSKRMKVSFSRNGVLQYDLDAADPIKDVIVLLSDGPVEYDSPAEGIYIMRTRRSEAVFYLAFGNEAADALRLEGWDGLWLSHKREWAKYWEESRVPGNNGKITDVCRTAEYHLKTCSTRWSIPIGICPTHWQGRYFGFDEFFAVNGLLAAGHFSTAKKVPEFRARILPNARKRAYSYFGQIADFAKYMWETVENPDIEGAPGGFWQEHIFHMANIGLETWSYCVHAHDTEFLRNDGWAVIRACAEFFRICACYESPDGRCIIGKCTDLERLGPAHENAFMTTCGAIALFRVAAEAARKLGVDQEYVPLWENTATALLRFLPHDGTKYVSYPGCKVPSIGVLSGIYPYGALPTDDSKQIAAIEYFLAEGSNFGNMYPIGEGECTWYACWKVIALLRLGHLDKAEQILYSCAESTGCFSEIFEIYETGDHPWLTTAEGIFLQAAIEYSGRSL